MKTAEKILLLFVISLFFSSCSIIQPGNTNDTLSAEPTGSENSVNPAGTENSLNPAGPENVISPFVMFERIKKSDGNIIDSIQVDSILKAYDIYDKIAEKVAGNDFSESEYSDAEISGFSIGSKKTAILLLRKGHLYIYVIFSNEKDKWKADGFACHNERFEPVHRFENSSDGEKYWLVIKHESNHGTGLQIFNETWYNPDGSIAAQYPVEGSTEFFPQNIEPAAYAYFTAFADYDGKDTISISYSVNFEYSYKDSFTNHSHVYKFKSDYSPVIREYWKYDLQTQQLDFVSCSPDLPESFSTLEREASPAFGILQGYIDFYRTRLGNRKITTLEDWESFIGQNE